jgi:hypothetical protein
MQIITIKNRTAGIDVCGYYLNKRINIDKSVIEIGKPLLIVYQDDSFFNHEKVINVQYQNDRIEIDTTNKFWILARENE